MINQAKVDSVVVSDDEVDAEGKREEKEARDEKDENDERAVAFGSFAGDDGDNGVVTVDGDSSPCSKISSFSNNSLLQSTNDLIIVTRHFVEKKKRNKNTCYDSRRQNKK
mgnify:CR=1 FL=1